MEVRKIMTARIWSCSDNGSLATAAATMLDHDCGFVPIVDRDGEVLGVLTDRDICMAVAREERRAADIPALSVSSRRVISCAPEDDIHEALARMENAKVQRLVVVDENGVLKGVISMTDVLRHTVPSRTSDPECLTCAEAVGSLRLIRSTHRARKTWTAAAE